MTAGGRSGFGLRSNLELDAMHTEVLERGDHRALSTRACPQYWEGNCLLLDEPPAPMEASEAQWAEAIAHWRSRVQAAPLAAVGHAMLRWETSLPVEAGVGASAMDSELREAALASGSSDPAGRGPQSRAPRAQLPEGVTFSQDTVLVHAHAPAPRQLPPSIHLRLAESEADWRAIVEMVLESEQRSDSSPDSVPAAAPADLSPHARYLDWAYASARATFTRTGSPWWTAWDGPLLVGSLGLFHGPSLSRFQEVETRRSHRGRGVASALLMHALAHAASSHATSAPSASRPLVIVAETDGAPERLYRRLGFTPVSHVSSLAWARS